MNFWRTLPAPIIGLSPMDGVSDQPFRHITKKFGAPAVVYTEFTSVEGVCHKAERLLKDFLFDESQRPIIAQIYGTTPQFFYETALVLCHLGFDGIDINMGCPAKTVADSGAGAALIKTPTLAQAIIRATKQAVTDYWRGARPATDAPHLSPTICAEVERRHTLLPAAYQYDLPNTLAEPLPVSVKTRIGFDSIVIEDWIKYLLELSPAAIAVHGRTLKQQYGGTANWDAIGTAAAVVHAANQATIILGNGDLSSAAHARQLVAQYQLDGALIGRASFGNPWVFTDTQPTLTERLQTAIEHAQLFEQTYQADPHYAFLPMRKHLGWYVRGFPEAKQLRAALFQTNTAAEVATILAPYLAD